MDKKDERLSKKEQQVINDIINPTTDVPAYENFKDVFYYSTV